MAAAFQLGYLAVASIVSGGVATVGAAILDASVVALESLRRNADGPPASKPKRDGQQRIA